MPPKKATKSIKVQPPKVKKYVKPNDKEVIKFLFEKNAKLYLPLSSTFVIGSQKVKSYKAQSLIDFIDSHQFKRIFIENIKEDVKIYAPNIEADPFLHILKHIYDNKTYLRYSEIYSVFQCANEYSIPGIGEKLINWSNDNLSIYNCAIIYDQYLKIGNSVSDYLDKVLELINLHADVAFRSKWFTKISKQTLIKILESDSLFIKEEDLYYACIRWINAQLANEKKTPIPKHQLLLFNEIKHLIRFPLMSKKEFNSGPAKSGLFTSELAEFEQYFQTKDIKVLSVNYNSNKRDELPIQKLHYDSKKSKFIQLDRFSSFSESFSVEPDFILEDSIDLIERDAMMKKKYGKNYSNDGQRKRKESTKETGKNKKMKTGADEVETIHVFKFQMLFENKEQIDEYWNNELIPEIHVNSRKLDIQFKKYVDSGNFYFSLDKPVALSTAKEFKIAFRTKTNVCLHNTFKLKNVTVTNEEESKIDIKLKIKDKNLLMAEMADIYFVFKEDYMDTSLYQSSTSRDTSMIDLKEAAAKDVLIDSSFEEFKENLGINLINEAI